MRRSGEGVVDLGSEGRRVRIAATDLGPAVHGDQVEVRITRGGGRGQPGPPWGRLLRVLAREPRRLAGTVVLSAGGAPGSAWFEPVDERYPAGPLAVAGDHHDLRPGERLVVRLGGGPAPGPARYSLLERLSDGTDPAADPVDVANELGLALRFPHPVRALAAERTTVPDAGIPSRPPRRDLRALDCITIDPAAAQDFDDAISWRPLPGGRQEVGIHIADVSWYVERGDPLDLEARRRGTSVYLPGRTLPMLPEALSAGVASLVPGEERAAVSVLVELDDRNHLCGWRLERSRIRSRQRLTYEQAEGLLGAADRPARLDGWQRVLVEAAAVSRALRARRLARRGLELALPEYEAVLDPGGRPLRFRRRAQGAAHRLVEEHMLLANELLGGWARAAQLPILFRVHERPRWERLLEFGLALAELGLGGEQRNLADPRALAGVLAAAAVRGAGELVATQLLRALEKARYDAEDCGHFGLGLEGYCHFTSPIRRYPDLHNHRVLLAASAALQGADAAARAAPAAGRRLRAVRARFAPHLEELAAETSARERDAQRAERLVLKIKALRLLARRLGEALGGQVAAVTGAGLHVQLDDYPIQGWLPRERLPGERWTLGARGHSLEARRGASFGLGQRLRVRLERVSIVERELELGLLGGAR